MKTIRIAAAALLLAAGAAAAQKPVQDGANSQTVMVDVGDPAMNTARDRAIAELPDFFRRFAAPASNENGFEVKFDIDPGDARMYVWAGELDRSTTPMTGMLMNDPPGYRRGQRVPIRDADIIDWSFFRGPVLQGAYTERVLLDRIDPAQAAEIRRSYGWE